MKTMMTLALAIRRASLTLWTTLHLRELLMISLTWVMCGTVTTCSLTKQPVQANVTLMPIEHTVDALTPETPTVETSPTYTPTPAPLLLLTHPATQTKLPASHVPTSTSRPMATGTPSPLCSKRVAFQSQQLGVDSIALIDICSRQVTWLTGTDQRTISPRWSPNGQHIAFLARSVSEDDKKLASLWLLDVKTRELTQITHRASILFASDLFAWSPDGQEILFSSQSEGSVIVRLDNGETHALPEGLTPPISWSPDGAKIAISINMDSPDDDGFIAWTKLLAVIRPDGHWIVGPDEESLFFLQNIYDWHWSPDSELLALVAFPMRGTDGDILLYKVGGDNWIFVRDLQELLPSVADYGILSFDWSPTGEEMAFVLVSPDDIFVHWGQVYIADRDLTRIRTLTPDGMYCIDTQWSPDGSQLAFVCEDGELNSLWIVDADGTGLQRITEPAKGMRDPQWQPLPQP